MFPQPEIWEEKEKKEDDDKHDKRRCKTKKRYKEKKWSKRNLASYLAMPLLHAEWWHPCAILLAAPARCLTNQWSIGSMSFIAVSCTRLTDTLSNFLCKDIWQKLAMYKWGKNCFLNISTLFAPYCLHFLPALDANLVAGAQATWALGSWEENQENCRNLSSDPHEPLKLF